MGQEAAAETCSWQYTAELGGCEALYGISGDERVGAQTLSAKRFESGRIVVDNEAEPDLTVVTINERKDSSAALLDVASAMTGIGVLIHEAIIQVLLQHLLMRTRHSILPSAE